MTKLWKVDIRVGKKLGKKKTKNKFKAAPPKFRELRYLKHIFSKKARMKGETVYSSH